MNNYRRLTADQIKGLVTYEPHYPDPDNEPCELLNRDAALEAVSKLEGAFPALRNALVAHQDEDAQKAIIGTMAGLAVLGDAIAESMEHASFHERAKATVASWAN